MALYREELSLRPPARDIPHMRYMEVSTYHVRPGHDPDFLDAVKLVRAAYEKADTSTGWAMYQVQSGAPNGTYFVFRAVKALSTLGPDPAAHKAFMDALGEEDYRRLMKLESDSVVGSETNLYTFDPKISDPPAQFVSMDPAFWRPAGQGGASTMTMRTGAEMKNAQMKKK